MQEGTFTITNPGVFGSLIGTPIINQPQVGHPRRRRDREAAGGHHRDGDDTLAIRHPGMLSLPSTTASWTAPTPTSSWPTSSARSRSSRKARSEMPRTLTVSRVRVRAGAEDGVPGGGAARWRRSRESARAASLGLPSARPTRGLPRMQREPVAEVSTGRWRRRPPDERRLEARSARRRPTMPAPGISGKK